MIDYTPADTVPPIRNEDGTAQLPRLTVTLEQRNAAIAHLLSTVDVSAQPRQVEGRIHWTRQPASVLRVMIRYETTSAGPIALEDGVVEMTEDGAEIKRDFHHQYRQLEQDIADLVREGML